MEYRCFLDFSTIKGEGMLTATDDEVCCFTDFDQYAVPFADISSIDIENYQLVLKTAFGTLKAARLGKSLNPAFLEITEKYNAKVRKALFQTSEPILSIKGEYKYNDDGGTSFGTAVIELFERCICILPPNEKARRVPLCFVRAIDKSNYKHTLTLDTGEKYEFMRLGLQTDPFDKKLSDCMAAIRKNAVSATIQTDASLDVMQSAQIAKLMPEGVAASVGELEAISPTFPGALEKKISQSHASETYPHFKQICDPKAILIGIKSTLAGDEQKDVLWIIVPKTKEEGGMVAIELAVSEDTAAATYLYRFTGGWDAFSKRMNHAIEAVEFHREVIFLSDEDLNKKENAPYRMAITRTPSLALLRGCFAGRVIHASMDSWSKDLEKKFQ